MARFSVESAILERGVQELNGYGADLEKLCAEVESVRGALGFQIRGQERISARLRDSAAQLISLGRAMRNSAAVLDESAYHYRFTEGRILGNTGDWSGITSLIQAGVIDVSKTERWNELSVTLAASGLMLKSGDGKTTWEIGRSSVTADWSLEKSEYKFWDSDDHTDWKKDKINVKQHYDEATGEWVDDPSVKFQSPSDTIWERKAELKAEQDVYRYHHDDSNWDVDARVGHSEAYLKGKVGLYGYREDGSEYLSPAISAEVGASTCLFVGTMAGTLGSDMLGLYGDAKVEAGKLEASAGVDVSIWDSSGKLNPQAYAHVGGEALLGSIEGSAGATVLGGKFGVSGKLEVGLDAHLEVGIQDGVVKFDAGLAIGAGGSLSFEVDVGGMVDAVVDASSSMLEAAGNFISDGVDAIVSACTSWMWWMR
ncbi:MAG: hypothetical protein K2N78_06525 [Oscillospiraceae bacterium]|nr:hypothetical protein [Oscillospiraceae bacterium]